MSSLTFKNYCSQCGQSSSPSPICKYDGAKCFPSKAQYQKSIGIVRKGPLDEDPAQKHIQPKRAEEEQGVEERDETKEGGERRLDGVSIADRTRHT